MDRRRNRIAQPVSKHLPQRQAQQTHAAHINHQPAIVIQNPRWVRAMIMNPT
jgi:hypothetical protein